MRRPGAASLLALALGISAGTGVAAMLLPLAGLKGSTAAILIIGLGCYNLALICRTQPAAGRAVGCLLTLALTLLGLMASSLPGTALLTLLAWTWVLRCALLHRSLISCFGDAALLAAGVAAALWAYQAGAGLALSAWCFYLLQALLPWLPVSRSGQTLADRPGGRGFAAARSRAEAALKRIYAGPLP